MEYSARRGEYRYLQLLQLWGSCSECGGHRLMRPARTQRVRIPEAAGICSDCESAFMLIEGNVRLIRPRA